MPENPPRRSSLSLDEQVARRLGQLLCDERGAAILAALQLSGSENRSPASELTPTPPPTGAGLVGIWQQDQRIGGFVRREQFRHDFQLWADVRYIPPKSSSRRVVLIGESVARGFLYDPVFTPARLLQDMLVGVAQGAAPVDVVDLARTDLSAFDAVPLIQQAALLEPDVVVLWLGNNWIDLGHRTQEELESELEQIDAGYRTSHRIAVEHTLPRVARRVVDAAADLCASCKAAGVVIVPEFNLADWQSEPGVLLPYLPGETHVAWMQLRREAKQFLETDRAAEAVSCAEQMISLDEGLSAVSHRLHAQGLLSLGRTADANQAFIRARDSVCGLPVPASPRCPAAVQESLRQRSEERGLACVDLREVLRREIGGDIPDSRLFLDYCHHNLTGLRVAMAETAAAVRNALGEPPAERASLQKAFHSAALSPSLADQAIAHLTAAIHNAHHGQPYEVVEIHCLEAIRLDPDVRTTMALLLALDDHRSARWLCAEFEKLMRSPILARYLIPRKPYESDRLADDLLHTAMRRAASIRLDPARRAKRIEAHSLAVGPINLLEYEYRARSFHDRKGHTLGPKPGYFASADSVTRFSIALDGISPTILQITYRMPVGVPAEHEVCAVEVNGNPIQELGFSSRWRHAEIVLPASSLVAGLNTISVSWPLQTFAWPTYRENRRYCLQTGEIPHALPVYGEIHQCTLSSFSDTRRAGHISLCEERAGND